MSNQRVLVVTTINDLGHQGLNLLAKMTQEQHYTLLLIGDEKTPPIYADDNQNLLYFDTLSKVLLQLQSGKIFPRNHYARKNLGYLLAAEMGCEWISETDDDNLCSPLFWQDPPKVVRQYAASTGLFVNTFTAAGVKRLWPRGIPLNNVLSSSRVIDHGEVSADRVACIQGLTSGEPDVDAVARALFQTETDFQDNSFLISNGFYAPTNSQMTKWSTKDSLPVLYLPFTVSWRVADIWRGYIAQRFFFLNELNTLFRGGMGFQRRNPHDIRIDFLEEVEVHTKTHLLIDILGEETITSGSDFMQSVYSKLIKENLVKVQEAEYLEAWLADVAKIKSTV